MSRDLDEDEEPSASAGEGRGQGKRLGKEWSAINPLGIDEGGHPYPCGEAADKGVCPFFTAPFLP
jgi:hypothetical protein